MHAIRESDDTGTQITFWPDPDIFKEVQLDYETVANRLRELAFLHPGLEIVLLDHRHLTEVGDLFLSSHGLVDFLQYTNRDEKPLHTSVVLHAEERDEQGQRSTFDAAFQWTDSLDERVLDYVNSRRTIEGGTHVAGFRQGLCQAIRKYPFTHRRSPRESPMAEDIRESLKGVLSVQVPEPQFESQTRSRLNNPEVQKFVKHAVAHQFSQYLETHPNDAEAILDRIQRAQEARSLATAEKRRTRRKD
jgi:DNA gyrase subunit B